MPENVPALEQPQLPPPEPQPQLPAPEPQPQLPPPVPQQDTPAQLGGPIEKTSSAAERAAGRFCVGLHERRRWKERLSKMVSLQIS